MNTNIHELKNNDLVYQVVGCAMEVINELGQKGAFCKGLIFKVLNRVYRREIEMDRDGLIEQVKKAVNEIEPDAEIILYGSRSRGDSTAESDWDLLILIDDTINDERIDKIRYRLYQIEWDSGEILSSIIRNRKEWHSFPYTSMPLYHKIENEGMIL